MLQKIRNQFQGIYNRFLRNPLIQRVIRNSSYLFSAQVISAVLSMGQGILTARLLGVVGAGLVGIITQFSSSINRLVSFRMGELVVSYVGEFHEKQQPDHEAAVFKAAVLVEITASILAFALILLLAELGAQIFAHDENLAYLFMLYGTSILANFMSESSIGLLQIYDHFRPIAVITIGQSVLTIILIAAAFIQGGGLEDVVVAYLAGKVVWGTTIAISALWVAAKEWGFTWWRAPLSLLAPRRDDLLRFSISTNLSGTLKLVTRDSEMLWLAAFSSPLQVGYYKIARAITNIVMMPVTPLISTSYRELAREVASKQWENVRYLLRSGTILASSWTIPASLALIVFGPWIVALYGAEFLPESYITLLILLVGVFPNNVFFWNQLVLLPLGLPEFPTKVQFVAAIIYILGIVYLVPRWGAYGMAAVSSLTVVIVVGILVLKSLKEIRKNALKSSPSTGE
jgi:O-antigen/teichoic acid export membrane protein